MPKAVLHLMTEKGLAVLRHAVGSHKAVIAWVVVGTDSHVENDFSAEIAALCAEQNIACHYKGAAPAMDTEDYCLAVSWRWMISHPKEKLIVFHDSLLPKYRGFAPLVNMLINGEPIIGVTAILGSDEYDKGDIIGQARTKIEYPIKIHDAIALNNANFLHLARNILSRIAAAQTITGTPQVEADATYSIWRDAADYAVDWSGDALRIKRFIDAIGPPYASARAVTSNGDTIILEEAEVVEDVACEIRHCGKVIFVRDGNPVVICGQGLLQITKASMVNAEGLEDFLPIKTFRLRFY